MIRIVLVIFSCVAIVVTLAGCGPSQAELDAEATQIAADTAATQTAEAPTPTNTITPTFTPMPTETPMPTNTPVPPTETPTSTLTPTSTSTVTPTPTSTATPTPAATATATPIPTLAPTATPALGIGSTMVREMDGAIMVYVPAGTFQMGTDVETVIAQCEKIKISRGWVCRPDIFENAEPIHDVTLDGFYIDQYEVTNAQYNLCAAAGVCAGGNPDAAWADYPVTFVPWAQAQAYCQWVGGQLPTEAQWEYAARGPDGSFYPWGNTTFDSSKANTKGNDDGYERDAPVGSFPTGASWVGAQDMTGNVAEWVDDWYDGYPGTTYEGHDFGTTHKVIRGGSWRTPREQVYAAGRSFNVPEAGYNWLGFRCVQSP